MRYGVCIRPRIKIHIEYIFKCEAQPSGSAWRPTSAIFIGLAMTQRDTLCTEDEITVLVHNFYDRIRQDDTLGPIFNAHIHNWDEHLARMVSFWSSMLLGAGTYDGTPMPKHIALPGLSAELFQHWLSLFGETADALPNPALAQRAQELAQRVARSLWFGYQLHQRPDRPVSDLHHG